MDDGSSENISGIPLPQDKQSDSDANPSRVRFLHIQKHWAIIHFYKRTSWVIISSGSSQLTHNWIHLNRLHPHSFQPVGLAHCRAVQEFIIPFRFLSPPHPSLALWTFYLNSRCLTFLICKNRNNRRTSSWGLLWEFNEIITMESTLKRYALTVNYCCCCN